MTFIIFKFFNFSEEGYFEFLFRNRLFFCFNLLEAFHLRPILPWPIHLHPDSPSAEFSSFYNLQQIKETQ